jgi:hypothetical protein
MLLCIPDNRTESVVPIVLDAPETPVVTDADLLDKLNARPDGLLLPAVDNFATDTLFILAWVLLLIAPPKFLTVGAAINGYMKIPSASNTTPKNNQFQCDITFLSCNIISQNAPHNKHHEKHIFNILHLTFYFFVFLP